MHGKMKTDKGLVVGFWEEPKKTAPDKAEEPVEEKVETSEVIKRKPGRPKKNI
jgi:hypothetical protein